MSDRLLAQLVLLGALPLTLASAAEVWGWPRCLGWLAALAKGCGYTYECFGKHLAASSVCVRKDPALYSRNTRRRAFAAR